MIHMDIVEWIILALVFGACVWLLISEWLMVEPSFSLRKMRAKLRSGFSEELLYRRHIRPGIIKNANGSYLAMFEIELPSSEELDGFSLSDSSTGFAQALSCFGSCHVLHMYHVQYAHGEYDIPSTYPHPIAQWMDELRKEFFLHPERVFTSRMVLTVAWLPPSSALDRLKNSLTSASKALRTEMDIVDEFENDLEKFENLFRIYGTLRRLKTYTTDQVHYSEMLEHLRWCISGQQQPVILPVAGMPLQGMLAEDMSRKPLRIGDQHVRVIVVSSLGKTTHPLMLERLKGLEQNYTLVVRFLPDDSHRAKKIITDSLHDWRAKTQESAHYEDPYAREMHDNAINALGLSSSGIQFGRATVSVVLRHTDEKTANKLANTCVTILKDIGMTSYIAGWTAEDDYFSTLPADGYHSVRKYPIHALNVSHLFSPFQANHGRRFNGATNLRPNTPAIMYAMSPKKNQVRIHFSDRHFTDVGHHFGIGGTGAGKSSTMGAFVASYMGRYPGAGFTGIERGRSLYRLTRFMDGNFYDLLGQGSPGLALFSDVDDPEDARIVLDLIGEMITLQGIRVERDIQAALEDAMRIVADTPKSLRSLSSFYDHFQDPTPGSKVRKALRNYTRESLLLGNLLDAETDTFRSSRFNVIEMSQVMSLKQEYFIPVLRAIIYKSITQVRKLREDHHQENLQWLYQIDEAHTFLDHELGKKFIRELLKMGRKEKLLLGLWSNAADDFEKTNIMNDIDEACRTRFFFRNDSIENNDDMKKRYKNLGITSRGMEMLPKLAPRNLLYCQPKTNEAWEINLELSKAWLAIVGRTDKLDNHRVDEYIAKYGHHWRQELLRFEGVSEHDIHRFNELMLSREGVAL